jgi:hypothetical protein
MGGVGGGGFHLDEARPDNETGGVVDGQDEDLLDDFERQTVGKLFVFIRSLVAQVSLANQRLWGCAPCPGVC